MLPDRVSNPGPLTYESGALPTALRGPAPVWEQLATDQTDPWQVVPRQVLISVEFVVGCRNRCVYFPSFQ